jgi:hypothetical protein
MPVLVQDHTVSFAPTPLAPWGGQAPWQLKQGLEAAFASLLARGAVVGRLALVDQESAP